MGKVMVHASYVVDGKVAIISSYNALWLVNHMKDMVAFFGSRMTMGVITRDLNSITGQN